jgi:NAD-dependent dihydropyrimidine dehydrogenase PreA subunit
MDLNQKILFCGCVHYQMTPENVRREVLETLQAQGADVVVVPDLCRLAARREPLLQKTADDGPFTIVACYPRAVKWLLHSAGIDNSNARYVNMRTGTVDEILADIPTTNTSDQSDPSDPSDPDKWIPWFPVIDYDRCQNCMQCLDFCLFGVYEKDADGRVEAVNPDKCKTNCPACARICPAAAIMFPKLDESPINGAEVTDEDAVRANIKVNVEKILGDDVYAALDQRKQKRHRMLVDREKMAKAVAERKTHTEDTK